MSFRRVNRGQGHAYYDGPTPVPGVTTVLNAAYPKPALVGWAANEGAGYVVNHWDELVEMTPAARYKAVQGARFAENKRATARGRDIHAFGELLAHGEPADVPEHLVAPVRAYAAWLDAWDVEAMHAEASVINRRWRYAGTLDLIARIGGEVWLLDLKSGTRAYPDHAIQLAAYAHAETLLTDDGEEIPMPRIDHVGIVLVSEEGCQLLPVQAGEQTFAVFARLRVIAQWIWDNENGGPIGEPLPDPNGQELTRITVGGDS